VLADVAVKHSAAAAERETAQLARETIERGLADGLIVSGPETGEPTDADDLERVVAARDETDPDVPVLVGSGVTAENAAALLDLADGAIVGTAAKAAGETANPVDPERAAALVDAKTE
jgi:predicted TIM-barrel enzyme